jgi:NRAMP (natural resistance-associated macrophage protein)-like metal ion transporter
MASFSIKRFLKALGPGFVTGASDDDPSGIATYTQTGARFGYSQLWTALFALPFMTIVQEMCGRVGMVTGKGLSSIIKEHYAKPILYSSVFILFLANTINIGADLGAMASVGEYLFGVPFVGLLILIAAVILTLEIFVPYTAYAKILKYLTLSLFAYIISAVIIKQDWSQIAVSTFTPAFSFEKEYLFNIVAILGTTISPYLFFWQADQEVEEDVARHRIKTAGKGIPKIINKDIKEMRVDTTTGMLFSNIVMWCIIITAGSTLFANGIFEIETADQAALALKPLAGEFAFILFALGIIGTGLLAIPILAGSAAYALSETFNWKAGLNKKFKQAHGFYTVIIIATIIGVLINISPIQPFKMLYYTAVINGLAAPFLITIILLISNNKRIMGRHTNSRITNIFGWTIVIIMFLAALGLIFSFFGT